MIFLRGWAHQNQKKLLVLTVAADRMTIPLKVEIIDHYLSTKKRTNFAHKSCLD